MFAGLWSAFFSSRTKELDGNQTLSYSWQYNCVDGLRICGPRNPTCKESVDESPIDAFLQEHGLVSVSIFSLMPGIKGIVWRIYRTLHGPGRQDGAALIFLLKENL
jgi:hypothetical protein